MQRLKIGLITLVGLLLAACGNAQPTVREVTITASDIAYSTTTLEATVGQPIKVTFKNDGALTHDFTIVKIEASEVVEETGGHGHVMEEADYDLHVSAEPGTSGSLTFTPATAGTYEFYCTVAGHKEAGMNGTLTVKEP